MIHDFRDRLRSYELLAEMFLRQEGGGSRLDR
jgi:hypothetical protein